MLALLFLVAFAQDLPLARLAGDSSDLRRMPEDGVVSFPLEVEPGLALRARVLETRVDAGTVSGRPFTPTLDEAGSTLTLRPPDGAILSPGEYTVSLELASEDGRTERLSLRVLVPAADLRLVPSPAALEVVRSGRGALSLPRPIAVRELGERGVAALTAGPEGNAVGADGPLAGGLIDRIEPSGPLARGGEGSLQVVVSPEAPLGTSAVNLEIRAPELATPLSVPIQVLVRRPRWWLLIAAMLGASMQLIQKVLLPRLNARVAEDAERRELRRVVEKELGREDRALRAALGGILAELPQPFALSQPSTWAAQPELLAKLRRRFQVASQRYNERLNALGARADELYGLVGRRFQLPSEARRLLGPAETHAAGAEPTVAEHVEAARALLRLGDTDTAEAPMQQAEQDLLRVLNLCRTWADRVTRALGELDVPPARLPRPSAREGAREALLGALGSNAIVGVSGVRDLAVVLAQLQAVHDAKRQSKTFVYNAAMDLRDTAGRARLLLRGDARAAFDAQWSPFTHGDSTETDIQGLVAGASSLQAAILAALGAGITPDALALVADGHYLEALTAGGPELFQEQPSPAEPAAEEAEEVLPAPASTTALSEVPAPDEPPDRSARSLVAALIELVISCGLLGALVWATYADQFVGTMEEMLAIFAFAYGTNLGLDPLLGQLTGRVRPAQSAEDSAG